MQLQLAPAALKFEAGQGSVAPPRQQVLVAGSPGREGVLSGMPRSTVPWLNLSAVSGPANTAITVGANPAGLAAR